MKWWRRFEVYSCAGVFGVWAIFWALNIRSRTLVVVFLGLAAVSFVIAERERSRQRRSLREDVERDPRS